ncbi:hypothetical protein DY000_02035118 [Brassica cretica]|uniref:Uncharacterized protein n=1 Tax=Brassica cretica TaxID=69181 RepID=A0ABQ7DRJ6_BRACR|nr:hypothetical protein DY000_02035118 [Brassica cretica]
MAALAGASPASEPPDSSLPPPLAAYSPSHRSIPVTNSPSSSDLDLNNNDTVHQFPDLVKKPSLSTNQVIVSSQVSPEIDAAVHTSEHVRVSSDVALTPSVPIHGSYAAAVRASLPLESPSYADDISLGRAKVNIQLPRVTFPVLNENGIPRVRIPTSIIKEGAARHKEFVALSYPSSCSL